jgi:hypothetical protein
MVVQGYATLFTDVAGTSTGAIDRSSIRELTCKCQILSHSQHSDHTNPCKPAHTILLGLVNLSPCTQCGKWNNRDRAPLFHYGGECLAPLHSCFSPSSKWIGGWLRPSSFGHVEKKNLLPLLGMAQIIICQLVNTDTVITKLHLSMDFISEAQDYHLLNSQHISI